MQKDDQLKSACRNTVAKAMRELGLKPRSFKRFKPTTTTADPSKKPAENVLGRGFHMDKPNQKWVTDITYLRTAQGWVYLAAVLDLFSRKIVGWSMSESLSTALVSEALRLAIGRPANGSGAFSLNGAISEMLIYNRALNAIEITQVNTELNTKYDLNLTNVFVPEPTTAAFVAIGAIWVSRRNRKS